MAQLDRAKEEVAYVKLWLGVAAVTDITLAGWLVTASEDVQGRAVVLAIVGVTFLALAILILNRWIMRRIDEIGQL